MFCSSSSSPSIDIPLLVLALPSILLMASSSQEYFLSYLLSAFQLTCSVPFMSASIVRCLQFLQSAPFLCLWQRASGVSHASNSSQLCLLCNKQRHSNPLSVSQSQHAQQLQSHVFIARHLLSVTFLFSSIYLYHFFVMYSFSCDSKNSKYLSLCFPSHFSFSSKTVFYSPLLDFFRLFVLFLSG